ncbi:hypothetical protein E4U55_002419 [Claviceps digitariae]|nr:hypothetical protein E4U55_002419 [Claviceps digitariae]
MMLPALGFYLSLWALTARAASLPTLAARCDCAGTTVDSPLMEEVCGDSRLGPVDIHASAVIDSLTRTWHRLGGLCPSEFLKRWTNPMGRFKYPAEDGFQLDSNQHAIKQDAVLCPGTLIDRFGSEGGSFLAPAGMRYETRSIPPQNLVTRKGPDSTPFNYNVYIVMEPLPVTAGCIAPWFEQPGLGVQYLINGSVADAIRNGVLRKVEPQADTGNAALSKDGCPVRSAKCKPLVLKCPAFSVGGS